MTCIIGLVGKDGVITMGGDSAGINSSYQLTIRKDPKVFVQGEFVIGYTSSFRMGQIIQYGFTPPEHPDGMTVDVYMRTVWLDALRKAFEEGGFLKKDNGTESGGTFLVGYMGRLFEVESDFQIGECFDPFNAVGCGSDVALGAMHALVNARDYSVENPDGTFTSTPLTDAKRVEFGLKAAEAHNAGVRAPFLIKQIP